MGVSAITAATRQLTRGKMASFVGPGGCNLASKCGKVCAIGGRRERGGTVSFSPEEVAKQLLSIDLDELCIAGDEAFFGKNLDYTYHLLEVFSDRRTSLICNGTLMREHLELLRKVGLVSVSLDQFRSHENLVLALANLRYAQRQGLENLTCSSVFDGPELVTYIKEVMLPLVAGVVKSYEVIPLIKFDDDEDEEKRPLIERIYDPRPVADALAELTEHAEKTYSIEILMHDVFGTSADLPGVNAVTQPAELDIFRYTASGYGSANLDVLETVHGEPYDGVMDFPAFVQGKIQQSSRPQS